MAQSHNKKAVPLDCRPDSLEKVYGDLDEYGCHLSYQAQVIMVAKIQHLTEELLQSLDILRHTPRHHCLHSNCDNSVASLSHVN